MEDRAISLNAVLKALRTCYDTEIVEYDNGDEYISYGQAIAEIEQLPPVTPQPCEDAISRDAVLEKAGYTETEEGWCGYTVDVDYIKSLPSVNLQEPKTGHCEDCKQFRKLPYHADSLGKCIQHAGFCPKGDWYCADFEPQESER